MERNSHGFIHTAAPRSDRAATPRHVIKHICLSHEREQDNTLAAARDHVEKGLQLDPENRYLHFLLAELAKARR